MYVAIRLSYLMISSERHLLREDVLEFLSGEPQLEGSLYSHGNASRLLADNDGNAVAVLRYAESGTVAQAKFLGYVVVVTDGQDASCCTYALIHNHHSTVMKRRVLEEDVLDEPLIDACVEDVSRVDNVVKTDGTLNNYERSNLTSGQIHTRHHDGHDGFLVDVLVLVAIAEEEAHYGLETLMCSERIEEAAYVLLEKDNKRQHTHGDKLVHDGSEEAHLKHLTHEEPDYHKDDDADEDVERTALLHQSVDIEEHQGDKKDVDDVLYGYFKHTRICIVKVSIIQAAAAHNGLHGFLNVMHTQDGSSLHQRDSVEGDGSGQ